jgi:hypothetical protein
MYRSIPGEADIQKDEGEKVIENVGHDTLVMVNVAGTVPVVFAPA